LLAPSKISRRIRIYEYRLTKVKKVAACLRRIYQRRNMVVTPGLRLKMGAFDRSGRRTAFFARRREGLSSSPEKPH